jgi:hypothetical protein
MLTCFGMIWNYDKFSRWNTKFSKICVVLKKKISKFDCKKTYDILGQL